MADQRPSDCEQSRDGEDRPKLVLLGGGRPSTDGVPDGVSERATGTDTAATTTRLRHVVGAVLREERLRQGRTLADVAEEAAVSLQYLSEVERGRREISSDLLHVVHHALGLDLHQVLERSTRRLELRAQRRRPLLMAA